MRPVSASIALLVASGCSALTSEISPDLELLAKAAETCRATIESFYPLQGETPPLNIAWVEESCAPVWTIRARLPEGATFPVAYGLLLSAYSNVAVLSSDPALSELAIRRAIQIADDTHGSLSLRSDLEAILATTYRDRDPELFEKISNDAMAFAERSGDLHTIARRHRDLGELYEHLDDLERAEESYLREVSTYEELRRRAATGEPLPGNARIRGSTSEVDEIQRGLVLRIVGLMLPGARRKLARVQSCRRFRAAFPREQARLCCEGFAGYKMGESDAVLDCTLPEEKS